MVTLIVTWLNLGLRHDFILQWAKALSSPGRSRPMTGYLVMPMARRFTDRVVTIDGVAWCRSPNAVSTRSCPPLSKPANSSPRKRVDLCADAIAKREGEVGAFVTLDIEAARKAAQTPRIKDKPLRGLPVG